MNPPCAKPNPFPSLSRPRPTKQALPNIKITSPDGDEREFHLQSGHWVDLEKSDAAMCMPRRWSQDPNLKVQKVKCVVAVVVANCVHLVHSQIHPCDRRCCCCRRRRSQQWHRTQAACIALCR